MKCPERIINFNSHFISISVLKSRKQGIINKTAYIYTIYWLGNLAQPHLVRIYCHYIMLMGQSACWGLSNVGSPC